MNDSTKENNSPFEKLQKAAKNKRDTKQIQELQELKDELLSEFERMPNALREAPAGRSIVKRMRLLKGKIKGLQGGMTERELMSKISKPYKDERDYMKSKSVIGLP